MKVRVKNRYLDAVRETIEEPGEEFETDKERAEFLARRGYVEIIEEPEIMPAPAADPALEAAIAAPKPAQKRSTRKKKAE